jgi:hypothetical protein
MGVNADGFDPVGDFVAGQVDGMVTGYVVFITFINPEGHASYWGDTMENQTAFTTLGIGDAIATLERDRIVTHEHEDEDGDY